MNSTLKSNCNKSDDYLSCITFSIVILFWDVNPRHQYRIGNDSSLVFCLDNDRRCSFFEIPRKSSVVVSGYFKPAEKQDKPSSSNKKKTFLEGRWYYSKLFSLWDT